MVTINEDHKNYYKKKVMTFSKSKLWWILWVCACLGGSFMHQKCFNYALTNLFFGLFRFVWIIDSFIICSSFHFGVSAHPSIPKCYELRNIPRFLFLLLFSHLGSQLNLLKSLGVRKIHPFNSSCLLGIFFTLVMVNVSTPCCALSLHYG